MPSETIVRKKPSNIGLYVGIAIAVIAVAVVGVGYEAGWFTKTTTKTVTECPQGDTGTYPNCVAPTGPTACVPYSGQTLSVAGSSFVAPLQDQWEVEYTTNTLAYQSVGSGTGLSDLAALSIDAAASDAPFSTSQNKSFNGNPVLTMPDSAGGASVIYNLAGTWHSPLNFSASVLAGIFTGTITTWNAAAIQALNPADTLPSTQIIVVHRSDGSGTSYMFQQFLQWDSGGAWNLNFSTTWLGPSTIPGEIAAKGSSGVTGAVKGTSGSIGYVDLEYALSYGATYGAVENVQGDFVVPSLLTIGNALTAKTTEAAFVLPNGNGNWSTVNLLNAPNLGTSSTQWSYPIASFTYLMFYQHPDVAFGSSSTVMTQAIAESLANYLNWTNSPTGQSYAPALYYVPLPAFVVAWDMKTIGMMTWGSSEIPACQPGTGPSGWDY